MTQRCLFDPVPVTVALTARVAPRAVAAAPAGDAAAGAAAATAEAEPKSVGGSGGGEDGGGGGVVGVVGVVCRDPDRAVGVWGDPVRRHPAGELVGVPVPVLADLAAVVLQLAPRATIRA